MFTLAVESHIMIAHSFADAFFGPAQNVHGATYAITLEVTSARLGVHHVVMDIGALAGILREVLAPLDYKNLDEHPAFPGRTSTTERIAEHIAHEATAKILALSGAGAAPVGDGSEVRVVVRESPTAWAAFRCPLAS